VPIEARERVPILTYKDMPIWVCGFRIDDRFKVTSDTKKILKVMFTLHKQAEEDIQA
jgi:tRNA(Ile)-lysidine synthase